MLRYTLKRIVGVLPTLIIVVTFVFFFVRMIPGDPARLVAGEQATLDAVEAVRVQLGLDQPIHIQYLKYVGGLLRGDLGMSLRTKRPVFTEVAARYGNTMALTFASLLWSTIVGVILGVWSGINRGKWQDFTGMTLAVSGISLPNFWIGFLLIMAFSVKLRWFPTTGVGSWKNLVLPAIALGTSIAAIIARFTRSSIVEVLKEDYIRTARAKGLKEKTVTWGHAFRNSMISVVTVVGLQFGFLLGGSVVTEAVFAYPGLGQLLVESVNYRDYPAIQSLILIFSLQFIIINLIVDILYAILNPEIKLSLGSEHLEWVTGCPGNVGDKEGVPCGDTRMSQKAWTIKEALPAEIPGCPKKHGQLRREPPAGIPLCHSAIKRKRPSL